MGIFKKLLSGESKPGNPDNSKLLRLIDIYWKSEGKGKAYENVVLELTSGNSFLILPGSSGFAEKPDGWITTDEKTKLGLSSIYNLDGLKVLAAFTDERALLDWAKKPCAYTSMRSQSVLQLCEDNGIARIIINNSSSNTFVLEKDRSAATQEFAIPANEKLLLGIPETPLSKSIIEKLITRFKNLDNILEVYHYGQTKDNQFSLVLAFALENISENGEKAVIDAVGEAIADETLQYPLDVFFIETKDWKKEISRIDGASIYSR
jgi:SseB protein N-terminal domain